VELLGQTRIIYEWSRLEQLDQWWHWLLLVIAVGVVSLFVAYWYRRDSVEHLPPIGWGLMILRLAAFIGLLLYFFQFDRRTEQRVVRDSRVAVLVDTSQSMKLPGTPSASGVQSTFSRIEEVERVLQQSALLKQLAEKHQVRVYRFDSAPQAVELLGLKKAAASLAGEATGDGEQTSATNGPLELPQSTALQTGRRWMVLAGGLGALAAGLLVISFGGQLAGRRDWPLGAWGLFWGSLLAIAALSAAAFGLVPTTRYPLANLFGADLPPLSSDSAAVVESEAEELDASTLPENWATLLEPQGIDTRLGDAIKSVLDRELGNPLAGIVVFSDGRSNAGVEPESVLIHAQGARVPLYFVGVGSDRSPPNVEVVEVDVPRRLYPGDRFSVSALVGSSGYGGRTATVQVLSGPRKGTEADLRLEEEQLIELPADGSLAAARFTLEPRTVGEWQYVARVLPLADETDRDDNQMATTVEVIERKNRVLIAAGGPTREYQFARNLLYRDRDVESHVLLQTGTDLTSQEAQRLLDEFPASRAALSEYDAVLAFDLDWTRIPDAAVQALEQWVAEQAGGLLLVAGSVEMPKWVSRSAPGTRAQYLRMLSPVVLDARGSTLLAAGRVESEAAWPLEITTEGKQTDFLWLTDDPLSSQEIWSGFSGVYSFYAAYQLKPGAKALALFSDPTASVSGQAPIYLASQFYGAGRVVFQGSGEMWRLRSLGDQYFDRYYTKLVRWISQGRLLLDSDRGVLLVDREEALQGEQVAVRAVLKNERYEPLVQSEVIARLIDPRGRNVPLSLRPLADGSQPGVYTGQFPLTLAGQYRLQLQLGGIGSDEVLTADVQARVPAMEMQHAQRHDRLMNRLATESGGAYWIGAAAVLNSSDERESLVEMIQPQDQVAFLPGAPDRVFQLRWLGWLMALIAGCLSLEWLARRLHRLA
jgi:hypothetical protein